MKKIVILMLITLLAFCTPIYAVTPLTFTNIGSEYPKPNAFVLDRSDFTSSKLYVACEKGNLLSSQDQGATWNTKNLGKQDLIDIAKRESYWVMAMNKNSNAVIMSSTEGRSWSFYDFATPIRKILNDNNKFYLLTEDNRLYTSETGGIGTWVYETQNEEFTYLTQIQYSPEASKYFILMDEKLYTTSSLTNVPTLATFSEALFNNHRFNDFIIKQNTIYLLSPTEGIVSATLSLNNLSYVKESQEDQEIPRIKESIYTRMVWQDNKPIALTKTGDIVDEKGKVIYKTGKELVAPIKQIEADSKYLYILLENEGLVRYDFDKEEWKGCLRADASMRTFKVQNDTTTLISNESPYGDNVLFTVDEKLNRQTIARGYGYKAPIFKRQDEYVIRDNFNKEMISKDLKNWTSNESKMITKTVATESEEATYHEFPNQVYFKGMCFSFQTEKPTPILTLIHDESIDQHITVNRVANIPSTSKELTISKTHDQMIDVGKFNLSAGNILSLAIFNDQLIIGTDEGKVLALDVVDHATTSTIKIVDMYSFPHLNKVSEMKVLNDELVVREDLQVYHSKDMKKWESAVVPTKHFKDEAIRDIAYGVGLYVAIGTNGQVATSTDLKIWQSINMTRATDLTSITYDGEKFIICGEDGSLFISNILSK